MEAAVNTMYLSSSELKRCTICGSEKPFTEFHKQKNGKDGVRANCKKCASEDAKTYTNIPSVKERLKGVRKAWDNSPAGKAIRKAMYTEYNNRPEVKERHRAHWFMKQYGITLEEYKKMYDNQNGNCAICGEHYELRGENKLKTLHVDHDHETGDVRGLLCHNCNSGIGYFKEDLNLIKRIEHYLSGDK